MNRFIRNIIREYLEKEVKNNDFVLQEEFNDEQIKLESLVKKVEKKLGVVYKSVTGTDLNLPKIQVKLDPNIKDGKIGGFIHPEFDGDSAILGIKPKALNNMDYLIDVITHELIHASVGEDLPDHKEHSGLFNKLAEKMGLPVERRD
ncbi:MAG: hypothetical protein GTN59_11680 [Candidatus Dadabacteria bacterium]|nr:hypothetical protein [Candidatus Dadabacteria bacterium]